MSRGLPAPWFNMVGNCIIGLMVLLGVALIGAAQVYVWNECRETHSFLYCLHILGR